MKTIYYHSIIHSIRKTGLIESINTFASNNGYHVKRISGTPVNPKRDDILIIWNRHLNQHQIALEFEKVRAMVVLFENPYIKQDNAYSIGLGYHNDIHYSLSCKDNGERFRNHGIEIKPWKTDVKNRILICTQAKSYNSEGLGYGQYKQPLGWDSWIIAQCRKYTDKEIRFRISPKCVNVPSYPFWVYEGKLLQEDLEDVDCIVTHSSNSATEALLEGVPVVYSSNYGFFNVISSVIARVNNPLISGSRERYFNRMAWNQYTEDEIASGFLFDILKNNSLQSQSDYI